MVSSVSSIRPQSTTLMMRGHTTDGSMTVGKVKEMIFDRLCKECKARGAGAWLEREALRAELAVPEDLFHWALTEMTSGEGSLYLDRDYTGKRIGLGMRGRLRCQEGRNPFASAAAPSDKTTGTYFRR